MMAAAPPTSGIPHPSLLERIQRLDATKKEGWRKNYVGFLIKGQCVGQVDRSLLEMLSMVFLEGGYNNAFYCKGGRGLDATAVGINGKSEEELTKSLDAATDKMIEKGIIKRRHGDRYGIFSPTGDKELLCTIDRHAAPYFGVTSIGVHLLCFSRGGSDGSNEKTSVSLWMAQRAADKSHFPLKWDPTIAGGHPIGISLKENMMKEAQEEASICEEDAARAKSVSCLSQMTCKADGSCMKQSLYYIWELEVDDTFKPCANDGEVVRFELWDAKKLEEEVRRLDNLRPAMRLVITDFLVRHGIITPDSEKDFAAIQAAMHTERQILL